MVTGASLRNKQQRAYALQKKPTLKGNRTHVHVFICVSFVGRSFVPHHGAAEAQEEVSSAVTITRGLKSRKFMLEVLNVYS